MPRKSTRQSVNCQQYGTPLGRRNELYCSRACHDAAHNVTRTCPSCGREFTIILSHTENGSSVYCSRRCADVGRRKRARIEYNGATYYHTLNGCQRRGNFEYLHRAVWEDQHGPIPPNCVVIHKDNDRTNNAINNLDLLAHQENMKRLLGKNQNRTCSKRDRPARQRGLCHRYYQQLRAMEKGGWQVVKGKQANT